MTIGQQVTINSTKFAYKHYQGRMGVVVGYDEVKNEYLVWCNWATLTIPADELTALSGSENPIEMAPKFSLPEIEVEANSVESAPAPRKRGRPAKVHAHPMVPTSESNFENEYNAEYIAEETKKYPEPENNLPEQESLEPHGD